MMYEGDKRLSESEETFTLGTLARFLVNLLAKGIDPDLPVAYECYSEQTLMKKRELFLVERCMPRPDGWVHDPRSDKKQWSYLLFPGN